MLNKYECIFIVDAALEAEAAQTLAEKFKNLAESSAEFESIEDWGKRKLAYPINYKPEGYYFLMNFSAESDFPKELERILKITDGILKYMVVKKDA